VNHPGESLLYVLSARKEFQWKDFKQAVDGLRTRELEGESAASLRSRVARALDGLGHIELIRNESGLLLAVCKPALVRLPTKAPRAVFAGARSPDSWEFVQRMAQDQGVISHIKPHRGLIGDLIPQVIWFEGQFDEALTAFASAAGLFYTEEPPAALLAHTVAGLDEVSANWEWQTSPDITWKKAEFNPDSGYFSYAPSGSNTRLMRYEDPVRKTLVYWLWNGDTKCEVDPDWAKFWIFRQRSQDVLYYDRIAHELILPKTSHLPKLIARSVLLCSGELPSQMDSSDLLVYRGVPQGIAQSIAQKLGQNLNTFRTN
jgi:hypothetical protein